MSQMIPAWVDDRLVPVDKLEVHRRGLRHPAVSVFLRHDGHLLLQRRAEGKYHTPGLWANTCCTHPTWGEGPAECARRRLHEELGLEGPDLHHRGQITYRAALDRGLTEHEVAEIFVGDTGAFLTPRPDPAEVSETRWVPLADLIAQIAAQPERYAPWLRIYLTRHRAQILGD